MDKHDHSRDERFMRRAMSLALNGMGYVSPNPMVGSVITAGDDIIGEGWHMKYGGPHAEVNAIASVKDESLLAKSTLYVTLEPCNHHGKTPPCTDLILKSGIKKVVVCNIDTNPKVDGSGVKRLRDAGVEVITGILDRAGRELNQRFFASIEKKRPFVILKWAETADGFIARENYDSKWISNEYSRQMVHKWRSEEDAILVGAKTAFHDDPQLNVRTWAGRNPVRIVIDRFLKLSNKLKIFDQSQPTLCYNVLRHEERKNLTLVRVDEERFPEAVLEDLNARGIQSVMVEGGSFTLDRFIQGNLWDEIRVFRSGRTFGKGIAAPAFHGTLIHTEDIHGDTFSRYRPLKNL